MVLAMVVVGGATRLTDSGLSITEWKPVSGALPPLNDQAWAVEFAKYQQIPQYKLLNKGMSLEAFKSIFWWEWGHRLLGRLVGVVFALPFLVFLALKQIPRRLIWRCWVLLGLGGLQGLVGWWMVSSGLSKRVSVAPERLTTHLGLALILLCALVWTALEAWKGQERPASRSRWPLVAAGLAGFVYLQSLMGALVAGNDAGLVYNDWPLMNGAFFPTDYFASQGFWLFHAQAAVQFNHRIGAYLLLATALACAVLVRRSRDVAPATKTMFTVLAALVSGQALMGIATLVWRVPLSLGVLHQAGAAIVLASAVGLAWRARRI
jgi:cytochrome c oxidase assembly protein subunit 15